MTSSPPFPSRDRVPPDEDFTLTHERVPLLNAEGSDSASITKATATRESQPNPSANFAKAFIYCLALELLCDFSHNVISVPTVSLLEQAICQRYYNGNDDYSNALGKTLNADSCKTAPIQKQLAQLRGWKAFFETLGAIIVALPVGRIADRTSHRKVLAIILIGMLLGITWTLIVASIPTIPIRLVWASSIFSLIGGGSYAAEMMTSVMASSASNEANRTRGFYYVYSCFIFSELIGPPVAQWTAQIGLWLPFSIGLGSLCLCFPVLKIMPETRKEPAIKLFDGGRGSADFLSADTTSSAGSVLGMLLHGSAHQFRLLHVLFSSYNMRLSIPIFIVGTFRGISLRTLLQYTSVRFHWTLPQTNTLMSEVALVNLALFSLLLPSLISILNRTLKPSTQLLNLRIVQSSLLILTLGSILIAFAPTSLLLQISTALYALGFGARSTLLSLVTSWTEPGTTASLYSAVFITEQLGMLIGEPLLQNVLAAAMDLPRRWMGLPFVCGAGFYLVSFTCALAMRLRSDSESGSGSGSGLGAPAARRRDS